MLKIFRRSSRPAPAAKPGTFSAPPPASPVELGLTLRARRERLGLSIEEARDATGVPGVDLEALERAQLELLHVEQAAIVGLWRYSELLGLDPAVLVPVLRSHWPRPALAVDALHSETGGGGTPCAQLAVADGILSKIAPKAGELTQGSSRLGLSEATRGQLSQGAASAVLTVALIGPAKGTRQPRSRSTDSLPRATATDDDGPPVPTSPPDPPPVPAPAPVLDPDPGRASALDPAVPVPAEPEASRATVEPRGRRWSSQLAHVVAERFGLDAVDDEAGDETRAAGSAAAAPILAPPTPAASTQAGPTDDAPAAIAGGDRPGPVVDGALRT